jgi:hypothetical protein
LSNSRPHCRMGARTVLQDFLLNGVHGKQHYMIDRNSTAWRIIRPHREAIRLCDQLVYQGTSAVLRSLVLLSFPISRAHTNE